MFIIEAISINDAVTKGLKLIREQGVKVPSRNGMTLEVPAPVATVYQNPDNRVLVSSARDANPFFHLMESLWILAGRSDVEFLTEFNKRMADFSDDGVHFNAPYGYRLRDYFGIDQLDSVIKTLSRDPNSRQAVCQIWDTCDLEKDTKDKACNMSIVFRIRSGHLDMVVYNRSNDMVWGAYGANVVQFSMIQEYIAAHLGIPMGTYTQVSNSFHVYTEGEPGKAFRKLVEGYDSDYEPYDRVEQKVRMSISDIPFFEHDLKQFFNLYDEYGLAEIAEVTYWESHYFISLVLPMLSIYLILVDKGPVRAMDHLPALDADDWFFAVRSWLQTRIDNARAGII